MTVWNFRMIMRNQLHIFLSLQYNFTFWSILHDFFKLSFVISFIFFFWFHFNSKSRSKPIALFLSLCIWTIINIICSLQFYSFLLSQIYQNHTLKWLQNFIKPISNSCKDNNILIECFKHNYYSKDVKLMRIII